MLSRRSESCPRLARKDPSQLVQPPPQPLAASATCNCTIQDLRPEDRQKVAKLLKQVVDLGQEVQQLKQQRDELSQEAQAFAQREQDLQEDNQQLQRHHHLMKKKLAQVLLVLRASQAKIAVLEASQKVALSSQRTVEVQTEPLIVADSAGAPTAASVARVSNMHACTGRSVVQSSPAPMAALPAGVGELPSSADSVPVHASLAIKPGGPPFLHVAPGAHVNITIHHAPETAAPAVSTPALAVPAPPAVIAVAAPNCTNGNQRKGDVTVSDCHALQFDVNDEGAGSTLGSQGSPSSMIAIPTSTVAPTCKVIESASTEVAIPLPDSANSVCWTPGDRARGTTGIGDLYDGHVQQSSRNGDGISNSTQAVLLGSEKQDGLGPDAIVKAPCPASAVFVGQSACSKVTRPRNILVDATMQRFEAVPVHEVRADNRDVLSASPMIVLPSDEVVAAASRLLGWQAQQGFAPAEGCVQPALASARDSRSSRKILSYDPAIGQDGGFYFVDVAEVDADASGGVGLAPAARPVVSAGSWPPLPPETDLVAVGMPATDRVGGIGPQSPLYDGEATLRQWSLDAYDDVGNGPCVTAMQQQQQQWQQQQRHNKKLFSERAAPESPCSSYTTETTHAQSPFSHSTTMPEMQTSTDMSASCSMSLSRMAATLDEIARRQRWDVQSPGIPGLTHDGLLGNQGPSAPRGFGSAAQLLGPGGIMARHGQSDGAYGAPAAGTVTVQGSRRNRERETYISQQGPSQPQLFRHANSSSVAAGAAASGAAPLQAPQDTMPQIDPASTCGSASAWLEGYDVADRYDDSLMDLLSQADEEMYNQQQQFHRQRARSRPRVQRPPTRCAAALTGTVVPMRTRALPVTEGTCPLVEAAPTRSKLHAAYAKALLAANLYEENDVLSVILEQEGHG